jgi:hypothetical protein
LEHSTSPTNPSAQTSGPNKPRITWAPQPGPQKLLIDCPIGEIFFGGARGGGKTDGVLGKFGVKAKRYGKHFNAVFFRKEMPQQDDLIERAKEIYLPLRANYSEQKKLFVMPGGGRIRFRPLETIQDAEKYQGQSLTDAAVEEAGNYESPAPIDRLNGVLRSAKGVPTQLLLTGNPGGSGQGWIRQRYVDPAPLGLKVLIRTLPNGKEHKYVYIPSKVSNNQILLKNDPDYINRLYLVGSPQLVQAWLEGDWNSIEGAFFPEFGPQHIVPPIELPGQWTRFRAMDWGSAKPFSIGWYAVSDGSLKQFPASALIKYREWYGMKDDQPNVGLKLTAEQIRTGVHLPGQKDIPGILDREKGDHITYSVIDPSAFHEDGGPSIASRMAPVIWRPADNKRIPGWDQVRGRLVGENGRPMLYVFSTCVHTIRTLPMLPHDPGKAEDVDTDSEDHAGDETRYACMSRPWVAKGPSAAHQPKDSWARVFAQPEGGSWRTK